MEENKNNPEVIDLREVFKTLWSKKLLFVKVWIVTFILACAYILPIPRTYTSELSLAPELGGQMNGGSLGDLAGMFGVNLNNIQTSDAFHPELYPDLIATNAFIVDLFDVHVKTIDDEIDTDYYTYLTKHQAKTFYKIPINWVKKQIRALIAPKEERPGAGGTGGARFNPFILSEETDQVVQTVRNMISCSVDKKTFVITITVEDQDPLICATMADTVQARLQRFITDYRTSKARQDLEYNQKIYLEAKHEYDKSRQLYASFSDANQDVVLQSVRSKLNELENEMQLKFNTYSAIATQLQNAKAKVQEETPAFTTVQSATVPIKPSAPRKGFIIFALLFFAFFCTTLRVFYKDGLLKPLLGLS